MGTSCHHHRRPCAPDGKATTAIVARLTAGVSGIVIVVIVIIVIITAAKELSGHLCPPRDPGRAVDAETGE